MVICNIIHAQYDWTTGLPDNGNEWRKFCVAPCSHPLRPLVLCFYLIGKQKGFRATRGGRGSFPLHGGTFARSYSVSNKAPYVTEAPCETYAIEAYWGDVTELDNDVVRQEALTFLLHHNHPKSAKTWLRLCPKPRLDWARQSRRLQVTSMSVGRPFWDSFGHFLDPWAERPRETLSETPSERRDPKTSFFLCVKCVKIFLHQNFTRYPFVVDSQSTSQALLRCENVFSQHVSSFWRGPPISPLELL